jgi:hypothetical protein
MSAEKYDLAIKKGETFVFTLKIEGVNLSAATWRMQGRTTPGATTTVFALASGSGIVATHHTPGGNSHTDVVCTLTNTTTSAFTADTFGFWDMDYTLSGVTGDLVEGTFYIHPEVSRA